MSINFCLWLIVSRVRFNAFRQLGDCQNRYQYARSHRHPHIGTSIKISAETPQLFNHHSLTNWLLNISTLNPFLNYKYLYVIFSMVWLLCSPFATHLLSFLLSKFYLLIPSARFFSQLACIDSFSFLLFGRLFPIFVPLSAKSHLITNFNGSVLLLLLFISSHLVALALSPYRFIPFDKCRTFNWLLSAS